VVDVTSCGLSKIKHRQRNRNDSEELAAKNNRKVQLEPDFDSPEIEILQRGITEIGGGE
jgi:hypothetical protein